MLGVVRSSISGVWVVPLVWGDVAPVQDCLVQAQVQRCQKAEFLKWWLEGLDCSRLHLLENPICVNKRTSEIFRCSEIFIENYYLWKLNWLVGWIRRIRRGDGEGRTRDCQAVMRVKGVLFHNQRFKPPGCKRHFYCFMWSRTAQAPEFFCRCSGRSGVRAAVPAREYL